MIQKFLTSAAFSLAILGTSPFLPQAAIAGEQPNLLIMGEDADLDTVPRNNRIFNQVLRAIEGELQARAFRVYDETAVTMGVTDPQRVRRPDAEILTVARRAEAPIDVAVVFQVYAVAEQNPYAAITDLRMRIPMRMINVRTGEAIGNYQKAYAPGDLPPLPVNCNRDCILEEVGKHAHRVGADVANVIATQLAFLTEPRAAGTSSGITSGTSAVAADCDGLSTAYTLSFRSFDPVQILRIEEYLVSFRGYEHHRPMQSSATESTYWYETCSDSARLRRNLALMGEHMDLTLDLDLRDNRILVTNIRRAQRN